MLIVGIHNTGIISSCAIVLDGKIVFASPEERFDRSKNSRNFPSEAIEVGLKTIKKTMDDVDIFSIGWNPAINIMDRYRAGFSQWPAYPGERFSSNPNHLLPKLSMPPQIATRQQFLSDYENTKEITYVTHHLAHSSNAYYLSGFKDAAIFSCDGYGERSSIVYAHATETKIEVIKEISFPHSIGQLYSTITQFLGFSPDGDEWKVMGAAAYGNPSVFEKQIKSLFHRVEEGEIELDLNYFDHFNFDSTHMFSENLIGLLGQPRQKGEAITQEHFDIAAALQSVVEQILFECIKWLKKVSKSNNLCLTGGVHMNSVFNGKLALAKVFEHTFIPFAPDDSGNSIGAALWAHYNLPKAGSASVAAGHVPPSPYLGKSYSDEHIEKTLTKLKIRYDKPSNLFDEVSELIIAGNVIGWFQGKSEFGQRALGNRSILGDPRSKLMKEKINSAIKYRESFRPFAPSILNEHVHSYFDVPSDFQSPFMEKVVPVRNEMKNQVPAIVHADGSGRLQTVSKDMNPIFHQLIENFHTKTGIPLLLNTSFNVNGEPIVESPTDAIRTFYSSGLDKLVLGNFVISK